MKIGCLTGYLGVDPNLNLIFACLKESVTVPLTWFQLTEKLSSALSDAAGGQAVC